MRFYATWRIDPAMIAVIFELWPAEGEANSYFDIAASLQNDLRRIDGFVSVERFESVLEPGKYLSLSFWRDEDAVQKWRNRSGHRNAQHLGRESIFANYRLRVAQVLRDYGMTERDEAPADSRKRHS
jgi:heme-degrading monooxygenase HmoA